jgi:predicted secreted hydrolase
MMRYRELCGVMIVGSFLLGASASAESPVYRQALGPRDWSFPSDHGRHNGFKTEWWYFTGNLREKSTGRRFGYQLTFFRTAFTPSPATRPSAWAMTDLYLAHAAVSDVDGNTFLYTDRLSRGRDTLAGAATDKLDVYLKNWSAKLAGNTIHLVSSDDRFSIDLRATATPPVLQGPGGRNAKGRDVARASYYYSMVRLLTSGTLTIAGRAFDVEGLSWMDHEFSSSALAENQAGWDWLALTLYDGSAVMIYRLRDKQGGSDYLSGTVISAQGEVRYLRADEIVLESSRPWKSPGSGAQYPQQWTVRAAGRAPLTVRTLIRDQELKTPASTEVTYYEGAAEVMDSSGKVVGDGYIEMTGYAKSPGNSF